MSFWTQGLHLRLSLIGMVYQHLTHVYLHPDGDNLTDNDIKHPSSVPCLNTCNVLDTCLTVGYIRQYFISYPTDKPWDSHRDIQTGTWDNNNPSGHIGQGVKKHFTITVDTYILMSWLTFKSLSMTICTRNDILHTFWFKSIVRIFGTLIINID